jgi:hypothetical protein
MSDDSPSGGLGTASSDDDSADEALDTTSGGSEARRSPPKRAAKLPEHKKRKSATKSPLLLLSEKQPEVTAELPFVPNPRHQIERTSWTRKKRHKAGYNKRALRTGAGAGRSTLLSEYLSAGAMEEGKVPYY